MDDLLLFAKTKEKLKEIPDEVMKRIRQNDLQIKEEKGEYELTEVEFLGHIIAKGKVSMTPDRHEIIERFQKPQTKKDLQSFIGRVNYVQTFIPNCAKYLNPLTQLMKESRLKVTWTPETTEAFEIVKKKVAEAIKTSYFNPKDKTLVYTDASDRAIRCVLTQEDKKGNGRIIACHSRSLNLVERRYSQHEREDLGMLTGPERNCNFVFGSPKFTLVIDSEAYKHLIEGNKKEITNRKLRRAEGWAIKASQYDYEVC